MNNLVAKHNYHRASTHPDKTKYKRWTQSYFELLEEYEDDRNSDREDYERVSGSSASE